MGSTTPIQSTIDTTKWFYMTVAFLLVDYGRPQDLLPIAALRPAMLIMLTLTVFIIKYRQELIKSVKQVRMIWYFILILALHIPFAVNNRYAYITTNQMLQYMPFILSVMVCVNSMERHKTFMKIYVGVMIYIALYALRHNGIGSGNYFVDENDVSLYINMVLPFCYFLLLSEKDKKWKLFYAVALIIGLVAVVVSFSRGGFVGLVLMFLIVWLVSPRKMLSIMLILFLSGGVYMFSGDQYKKEMETVTDTKESTANARLMSWASGWDMFIDNPLGVGGNNFQVRFPEYQGNRFKRGMWGRVAHSLWFTLFPELGIFGIVIYFRLIYYNVRDALAIKIKKKELSDDEKYINAMSVAFLASMAGFFASASFISVLYYPHFWYLTAIIVATLRVRNLITAGDATRLPVGRMQAVRA